ncbi:ribonuclease T2 family protein [Neorhizobium alkalisoli]|uniref:Ribonuclease T2 n=1 Tax=Neorhizobium alkalisoli TaxID=528178 RepID=A0A561R2C8_9HYPH|nr:ribonuclease [Neorhizobium alkalisoli]TWF56778.1 ribonuclease T2 [Neorhizobium alkalisoli]
MKRQILSLLMLLVMAGGAAAQERRWDNQSGGRQDRAGVFDFYVLSLSWSPSFCASNKGGSNDDQCGIDKHYRFIVHGLWPQYEKGYPDFCRSSEPDRVAYSLGRSLFDIMPSMGLIGHEWRKHGVCSGLSQRDYFGQIRQAFSNVKIPADLSQGSATATLSPADIETKFVAANPGMSTKGISTSCQNRQLTEVRICLTKDLQFRDCQEVDRDSCRAGQLSVPPPR